MIGEPDQPPLAYVFGIVGTYGLAIPSHDYSARDCKSHAPLSKKLFVANHK